MRELADEERLLVALLAPFGVPAHAAVSKIIAARTIDLVLSTNLFSAGFWIVNRNDLSLRAPLHSSGLVEHQAVLFHALPAEPLLRDRRGPPGISNL